MPIPAHRSSSRSRRAGERSRARAAAYAQRRDAEAVLIHLPLPTSVNDMHALSASGGIRLSDPYRQWLNDAGWAINRQKPGRIACRYRLTLRLSRASNLDLDNAIKATSDLLQDHGIIRNDREAEEIDLRWHGGDDMVVEVAPFLNESIAEAARG